MKKILVGYPLDKYSEFENLILSMPPEYSLVIKDYDRSWLEDNIHQFDILIPSLKVNVDNQIIGKAKKLQLIFTPTTGTDHINFTANNKYIKILSLNDYCGQIDSINSTAELAFSLLLSVARKINSANAQVVKSGLWERNNFLGHELNGKVMGVIGMGRIGQKLAKYGLAFGMDIVYWDIVENKDFRWAKSLNQLLEISDYIMICVSLNESTVHLINSKNVNNIKKGSFLVNTSRGKVIEEEVLCKAIDNGIISGLGVDVLEYELEDFQKSPIYIYAKNNLQKNIIITPHIGGATIEAWKKVFTLVFNEIRKGVVI
jgi:D-3-phosphoglycerate dehydrogenase